MERSELTQKIKQAVMENGFGLVGIAPVAPPPQHIEYWRQWIGAGHHGEMGYLENPARETIQKWWPEARSILLAGLFYNPGKQESKANSASQKDGSKGQIASYAVYPDYHAVIKKRLEGVIADIKRLEPAFEAKIFVDSSPILERSYAQMAGLGWIGKNTMLINKIKGSYFFLAGFATNLNLEPDDPDPMSHCGTCQRCIEACPTQCLTEYKLDASRCIAYLTIEKKTIGIEPALASQMDNHIFGCDICQEVCPFNRDRGRNAKNEQEERALKEWRPPIPNTLDLNTALSWSKEEYKTYFAGLPVLRAKWPIFLRNALIAAGNSRDPGLLPYLRPWTRQTDPEIAKMALWAINQLLSEELVK